MQKKQKEREQRLANEEAVRAEVCSTPASAFDILCTLLIMLACHRGYLRPLAHQAARACIQQGLVSMQLDRQDAAEREQTRVEKLHEAARSAFTTPHSKGGRCMVLFSCLFSGTHQYGNRAMPVQKHISLH